MNFVFLENEQQIRGRGNEGESQTPHQTLVIMNIANPMLCHSLQCYHCLLFIRSSGFGLMYQSRLKFSRNGDSGLPYLGIYHEFGNF